MRHFAVIAVIATSAFAQFMDLNVRQGSTDYTKYVESQVWSTASVSADKQSVTIGMNNNLFIQNSPEDGSNNAYKPGIRGGSIEYDVDLSSMDCGCVSGMYLVQFDNGCTQDPLDGQPNCKTIDVMQANPYGFNVAANPNPEDFESQCQYNMATEGKARYGDEAYGPGGQLIDTNEPFHVHTEFMATSNYANMWGLRTTWTQGGNEMQLLANCGDYVQSLGGPIEGSMGIVLSSWDNRGYDFGSWECQGACPTSAETCENGQSIISNISVARYGSNEDPYDPEPTPEPEPSPEPSPSPEPTPEPQPATFQGFNGYSDQLGEHEFFVKGLDNSYLTTNDREITMGLNNRAFVLDYAYDTSVYWSYWHNYLAGSVQYTVDVSQVPCSCVAGIYLVELDDETCPWGAV